MVQMASCGDVVRAEFGGMKGNAHVSGLYTAAELEIECTLAGGFRKLPLSSIDLTLALFDRRMSRK